MINIDGANNTEQSIPILIPVNNQRSNRMTTDESPDNAYIRIDDTPQSLSFDEQSLTWDDVFYSNEKDDHANVLIGIAEIGAFLIRPSSQANSSNDHQYTLSVYTFEGIVKYKILKLFVR